jgi:glycosyltransferase involved in cell wall biosynthesis
VTSGRTAERERDTVLFVAVPAPLGGSNRSLATLLSAIGPRVVRVLAAPAEGAFVELVRQRGLVEEHLPLRRSTRVPRIGRLAAALRIAAWALRNRGRLLAIHANATRGLNLAAIAALVSRVPVTVWVHDPVASPWGRRLGPLLGLLLRRTRWAAVSGTARRVAVGNRLCRADQVEIVPNPIDPAEVLGSGRLPSERVVVGYLGAGAYRKGFDLLPEVIGRLADLPIEWKLFTNRFMTDFNRPIWEILDRTDERRVSLPGADPDVRRVYQQCDIVFVPSRHESFSRVAAEAMLNGLPVVASDIEPLRELLGDEAAGLLFPVDDPAAAAQALRRLVLDADLRYRLGAEGRKRAAGFDPARVAERMLTLYGVTASPGS